MKKRQESLSTFLQHLQAEKLKTQEARTQYVSRKLVFATALIGLGSINIGNLNATFLLYMSPYVALVFDLYVFGEDYSVKRIGAFLGVHSVDPLEEEGDIRQRQPRPVCSHLA